MPLVPYYEHAGVRVFLGDCREIVPQLLIDAGATCVITDPPYGINHASNWPSSWSGSTIAGDESVSVRDAALALLSPSPMLVFGTWKVARPAGFKAILIFDKGPAFGMGDLSFPWKNSHEEIYVIGNDGWTGARDESVIKGHFVAFAESNGRVHQNEKPISLMKYLVSKTTRSHIIDPFCGSGTTLRGAKDLGRTATGIDVDERNCELSARLCDQEVFRFA